mmetsp:Transcript_27802/g.77888  ORF Transcript_27802/g.77888 Transcript_27802/m.77888 type:complete len:248 (-) Transcript_27802:100-843(-)
MANHPDAAVRLKVLRALRERFQVPLLDSRQAAEHGVATQDVEHTVVRIRVQKVSFYNVAVRRRFFLRSGLHFFSLQVLSVQFGSVLQNLAQIFHHQDDHLNALGGHRDDVVLLVAIGRQICIRLQRYRASPISSVPYCKVLLGVMRFAQFCGMFLIPLHASSFPKHAELFWSSAALHNDFAGRIHFDLCNFQDLHRVRIRQGCDEWHGRQKIQNEPRIGRACRPQKYKRWHRLLPIFRDELLCHCLA